MSNANRYCTVLGIDVPSIEKAMQSADANTYSLFLVALLERGEPMTLAEAARRFEAAGVAPAGRALASLKQCKPARPPIYRDGDLYALDPHDDDTDLWAFRLGLRPSRGSALRVTRPDSGPLPSPGSPISVAHLDEAWREGIPWWSAQRIAICVLDAHSTPMKPEDVLAYVRARSSRKTLLSADSSEHWGRGAPIRVLEDGRWALAPLHRFVPPARQAVIDRIVMLRRWSAMRLDPADVKANEQRLEREREARAAKLAALRRVILHAFPAEKPEAIVLLDVGRRDIRTYIGDELPEAVKRLSDYDMIVATNVRTLLRILRFDPGDRRLGELSPPQKTRQINRRGETLPITLDLLLFGSCGLARPFGDEKALRGYLDRGEAAKLRRRLESDAKSLFALYQYGLLHGTVRLHWGFLDERLPAPWFHRDESTFYNLKAHAFSQSLPLDVVVGSAPGWKDPWARARRAVVVEDGARWRTRLVGEQGQPIDEREVQLARVAREE